MQVTSPYMGSASPAAGADFAWHLRAWGRRALAGARRMLAARYPTYAEFEPVRRKGRRRSASLPTVRYRPRPPKLLEPDEDGRVSVASLNAEFDSFHLENEANPRWVAKPAVAYLWARTVRCGDCRAEVPLLKTRWLCKTAKKRVLLTMEPRGGRRRCRLRHRAGRSRGQRKRHAEARARPEPGRRHDERERREVSLLRCDRHDKGYSHRGPRGTDRRAHDGRRGGRAGGEGIPPADRSRDGSRVRDGGSTRPALQADTVRPSGRACQPGSTVAQLTRRFRPAALRVRHMAATLHESATSGERSSGRSAAMPI